MSNKVSVYDAWCDGSFRDARNRGGAGWVIRHDGALSEGSATIPALHKDHRPHGSDIAEVTAVVRALREIPAGSTVRLRLDCQNVMDWLKAGSVTTKKKIDIRPLQTMFAQANDLVQSMEKVEIIKITGTNNEHHNRAHVLSRTGSTTPKATPQ
jgi:ribonuclease HI